MKTKYILTALPAIFYTSLLIGQNRSLSVDLVELSSLTLNTEYSRAVAKNITIHLPLHWKPFNTSKSERDKKLILNPGIRFWKWHNYSGIFVSSSAFYILFNKTKGKFRYEGNAAGISLSAGYAKMLSRRWNVEFQAGLTLLHTKYDQYHKNRCGDYYCTNEMSLLKKYPVSIAIVHIF